MSTSTSSSTTFDATIKEQIALLDKENERIKSERKRKRDHLKDQLEKSKEQTKLEKEEIEENQNKIKALTLNLSSEHKVANIIKNNKEEREHLMMQKEEYLLKVEKIDKQIGEREDNIKYAHCNELGHKIFYLTECIDYDDYGSSDSRPCTCRQIQGCSVCKDLLYIPKDCHYDHGTLMQHFSEEQYERYRGR